MNTLIICGYNEGNFITKCLDSLENQIDKKLNLIFVDNNSSDNTLQIVKAYKDKNTLEGQVYILSEKRQGKRYALKTAYEFAKNINSDKISFSDADCIFNKRWNLVVNEEDLVRNGYKYLYGLERVNSKELKTVPNFNQALSKYTTWRRMLRKKVGGMMIGGYMSFDKETLINLGGFDVNWMKSIDTLMTLKAINNGVKGKYIDVPNYFSARRFLKDLNIRKWVEDKKLIDLVLINNELVFSPIRDLNLKVKDISELEIIKSLIIKSERMFRRTIILSIFDSTFEKYLYSKFLELLDSSIIKTNVINLVKKYRESLPSNITDIELIYNRVNQDIILNEEELLSIGGAYLRKNVFKADI